MDDDHWREMMTGHGECISHMAMGDKWRRGGGLREVLDEEQIVETCIVFGYKIVEINYKCLLICRGV